MDTYSPQTTTSIKVFRFDPHPRRKQLTIVGETVISIIRNGSVVKEFAESFKKTVQLIGLTQSSRVDSIVSDIFQTCPFIEDGNILRTSLKECVEELTNREYDASGLVVTPRKAADGSFLPRYLDVFDEVESSSMVQSYPQREEEENDADITKINQYVEMLYENEMKKMEGLRLISQLTKYNRNLAILSEHASALNAIIRTLREDRKKNMNLSNYILGICLAFAKFTCFHRLLIRHKVHQLILDKLDPELERYEKWKVHLLEKENIARGDNSRKAIEEFISANENFQVRAQLQNKILTLGFTILHHISGDRMVAKTLLHQGLITSLTDALDHVDFPLWESLLTFLKDLSTFNEFIEQMISVETLEKVVKILKGKVAIPVKVARASFGLLCNLSFHPKLRHDMVEMGVLTVFAKCLPKSSLSNIIAKALYIISNDSIYRGKMVKSGIAEIIVTQLTNTCSENTLEQVSRVKGALAVNLPKDYQGAKAMGECLKISVLVKQSIKNNDIMGMKIVRNVVETCPSILVDQQAGHIGKAVVEVNSLDFVLECIGTLAYADVERVDFPDILKKNRLVTWLKRQLMNYMNITNIVEISYQLKTAALEVIILLSNICKKEEGARFIVGEGFIDQMLMRLLSEEHADPQIIQQIVYLFNVCCCHPSVATFLVTKTQFPQELMAFALNIGGTLRSQCELTLHKLSEYNESWLETMTEHEFLIYNETWTTAITEDFKKEESESPELPSSLRKKSRPLSDYWILKDMVKGGGYNTYIKVTDDKLGRPCSSGDYNNFDDSTTDDDSMFHSISPDVSLTSGRNSRFREESTRKIRQLYWEEFGEEMGSSREWSYFLKR